MSNLKLEKAISDLAELKPGWALMADTNPADFLYEVRLELMALRSEVAELKGQITRLEVQKPLFSEPPGKTWPPETEIRYGGEQFE